MKHCAMFVKLYQRFFKTRMLGRKVSHAWFYINVNKINAQFITEFKCTTCARKCCYAFHQAIQHHTEKITKKKNRHQKEILKTS